MKMDGNMMLAVTVAVGSFLQGWVYVLLVGYPSYMKAVLNLESEPQQDSLVWFVSSIGMLLAIPSGKIRIGRRPLLVFTSLLYLCSSIVMLCSGNPTLILVSRFLDGFAWGFSYILVILYFLETAPRGFMRVLLPQAASLCGVCMGMMVLDTTKVNSRVWNLIFHVAFSLSQLYFVLVVFYLPESPKWLVRKGRIDEARHVLQMLRGIHQDIYDEMAMLVYSVKLEGATIEDYMDQDLEHGPQDVSSDNLSKPVTLNTASSQQGSIASQNATLVDPLLTVSSNANVDADSFTKGDDSTSSADASVVTTRVSIS